MAEFSDGAREIPWNPLLVGLHKGLYTNVITMADMQSMWKTKQLICTVRLASEVSQQSCELTVSL